MIDPSSPRNRQAHLLRLAILFVFLFSLILTLSPSVRYHTLNAPYRWGHWLAVVVWATGFWLIHREMERLYPESDPYVIPSAALLSGWGLLTIWRLDEYFGLRQTVWLAVGQILILGLLQRRGLIEWLRRYKYLSLVAGLLLIAATFFLGTFPGGNGPRLWLGWGGVFLQPSEPLKLLLIIYLTGYLAGLLPTRLSLFGLLGPSLVLLAAALGLLVAQRDLGTALLIIAIYALTVFLASGKRRILVLPLLGTLVGAAIGYQYFPVLHSRFTSWLNPWADPGGASFQIIQALIAFAAGGLIGEGPGLGSPGLVPVAHSDFVFSTVGEEMGFIGVVGMLLVFGLLVSRALDISIHATDRYKRYLSAGIGAYFAAQMLLITGGTVRLFPLTGVTLPFVSYGGSSLLTALLAILILVECSAQAEEEPAWIQQTGGYKLVPALVYAGIGLVVLLSGYWALVRQPQLLARTDNGRRYVTERFVRRGALLDRHDEPLVRSQGEPGSFVRTYFNPASSLITGYNSPLIGQSGLEAGMDGYLMGAKGLPSSLIWWHQLLYSQNPPGLDVRTSLDLTIQSEAEKRLAQHTGAVILLNSRTGEILTMASSPGYDANDLVQYTDRQAAIASWQELLKSAQAPLVNRATLGQYPPGPALAPFMLVELSTRQVMADPFLNRSILTQGSGLGDCVLLPPEEQKLDWSTLLRSGCPQGFNGLSDFYLSQQVQSLYGKLGFLDQVTLPLETAPAPILDFGADTLTGSQRVTPLQMTLAASVLSNGGRIPQPILTLSINSPVQGWVILPETTVRQPFEATIANSIANSLAKPGKFYWQVISRAPNGDQQLTWYLGGTLPSWQGMPLSVVVLLEENNPALAEEIGSTLLEQAIR